MKKKNRLVSLVMTFALIVMTAFVPKMDAEAADWTLVWNDEFNGSSLDTSKWAYDIGTGDWGWGNNELQYYTNRSENISVSDGLLKITARKENYNGSSYTSAKIKTQGLYSVKYGKIEARMAVPSGQGYWPAFWMLGTNYSTAGWPYCGEIDIMEHVNAEDKVYGTIHWDSDGYASYGGNLSGIDVTQYHTYSIIWDEDYIRWYCDDVQYHEVAITDSTGGTNEFHEEFFLMLNLAVGGNWPGSPDGTTVFPSTMYVDYVRVYQQNGSGSSSGSGSTGGSTSGSTSTTNGDSIADPFSNWTFYTGSDWAGAYAANTVNSNSDTTVTIAYAGYGGEWGIQLYDPSLTYTVGKTYDVSFDVTSSANKKIGLYLQNNGTDLINQTISLTANTAKSVSFTSSAATSTSGAVYLSMGNMDDSEVNAATTLYITNFKIVETGSSSSSGSTGSGSTGSGSTGGSVSTTGDMGISYESGNTAVAYVNNSSWADIHYTVNGGSQMNVRMTQSGTTAKYTITGLNSGDTVKYWFTYCPSGAVGAKDTAAATYTHSGTTTTNTNTTTNTSTASGTLDGVYYIKSVHSGKYLDVANGSAANGANIQQYEFNGSTAQQFKLVSDGNGYYSMLTGCSNYKSGVDVYGWGTANGTNIDQWEYHGGNCQKFEIVKVGNAYAIKTRVTDSKSCLDVYNWSTANGGNIAQYEYWGGNCQLWYLEKVN